MAPIYQEIEIHWNGKAYKVTPNYEMIQGIEQRLSLGKLVHRVISGDVPLSQLADLLAFSLEAAGCTDSDATAENIYAEMWDPDNREKLSDSGTRILFALLPRKLPRGNAEAPGKGANQKTSPGESTTQSPSDTSESNPQNSGE